jgi:hypothetical protein
MSDAEQPAPIAERLARLADDIKQVLGDRVHVEHEPDLFSGAWTLEPVNKRSLAVTWLDFGWDLQVETLGGPGGRWELSRTTEDADFLEDLVRSVVAGRATEVRVANRSRVTVTLSDGRRATETGYDGLAGCLPIPLWPRWGHKVRYEPYG